MAEVMVTVPILQAGSPEFKFQHHPLPAQKVIGFVCQALL
jgi:hypothetical protein